MQSFVVSLVLTLIIITGMGTIFVANFGSALPISCDKDNICENSIIREREGSDLDDRWEGTSLFPCLITDCCYNNEEGVGKSWEMCYQEYELAGDPNPTETCREQLQGLNPKYMFHCYESENICDEEGCYENCNYNGECEEGEFILCSDCW